MQRKTASWAVLSTDRVHCDSNNAEAYFGGGTKLTVLGKKLKHSKKHCNYIA